MHRPRRLKLIDLAQVILAREFFQLNRGNHGESTWGIKQLKKLGGNENSRIQ
jgi:hypothetical protein